MVNTAQQGYTILPLYAAVYGGRTLQFGFQYLRREDVEQVLPWRAEVGRNFLWAGQLGWVGEERLPPGSGRALVYSPV